MNISITIAIRKSLDSVRAWLDSRLEELVTMSVKARLSKIVTVRFHEIVKAASIDSICTSVFNRFLN